MNSYYLICSVLALTTSGIAWLAVRTSRDLREHCAELGAIARVADARIASLEDRVVELTRSDETINSRIDRLAAHEGRLEATGIRPGFTEAIALIEHGANADQLMESCGLGMAEARLVEVLYGREENAPAENPTRETIVVDAELNVIEKRPAA